MKLGTPPNQGRSIPRPASVSSPSSRLTKCSPLLPSFQHQQQVLTAVERAKQVSMSELNAIIGVSECYNAVTMQYGRPDGRSVEGGREEEGKDQ